MRVYVELARRSFQRHLAYRQATLAGIFTNAVFGVLIASVYRALYRSRVETSSVAGFDLPEIFAFIWIGQSLLMVMAIWGWWEMSASIQTGNVVNELMKPVNFDGYWLSQDIVWRIFEHGVARPDSSLDAPTTGRPEHVR